MIIIDGSTGEGGGQILRTALALGLVTGQSFRMEKIRAGRQKTGLLRQHLTAVNAATQIGSATVTGAALGSQTLTFVPGKVVPGGYSFAVGTAGSATLVLQTVLPALLAGSKPSRLVLEGGTHNPFAPPFDFLQKAFLPIVNRMGPKVSATLERYGFYPAGGGKFSVDIEPVAQLLPIELTVRGNFQRRLARAVYSAIPQGVAERELKVIAEKLGWAVESLQAEPVRNSSCPGNVLLVELESEALTEVFTGFGERGVLAERVAEKVVDEVREYLTAKAPVGEHLADQLLLPMALADGGAFRAVKISRHAHTNIEIIGKFLAVRFSVQEKDGSFLVTVERQ
jgi:RNA 3'-terminal phosphate cyclase (ATP)